MEERLLLFPCRNNGWRGCVPLDESALPHFGDAAIEDVLASGAVLNYVAGCASDVEVGMFDEDGELLEGDFWAYCQLLCAIEDHDARYRPSSGNHSSRRLRSNAARLSRSCSLASWSSPYQM